MSLKRVLLFTFVFLIVLSLSVFILSTFLLPVYIQSFILPQLANKSGIPLQAEIRRIGMTGIDIDNIILGDAVSPFLSAGSLSIDYSLGTLRQRHIDKIKLDGVALNCSFTNGKLVLLGFSPPVKSKKQSSSKTPALPFNFGQLILQNSSLNLEYNGNLIRVPFELKVEQSSAQKNNGMLTLYPRDQKLTFISKIDITGNQAIINLSSTSFVLERFQDIIGLPVGVEISSTFDIKSSSSVQLIPFEIQKISASIQSTDFTIKQKQLSFQSALDKPFHITINGNDNQLVIAAENFLINAGTHQFLGRSDINMSHTTQGFQAEGKLLGTLKQTNITGNLAKPFDIALNFNGELLKNRWNFLLKNTKESDVINLRQDNVNLLIQKTAHTLSGSGDFVAGTIKHHSTGELIISLAKTVQASSPFNMTGEINLRGESSLLDNISGTLTVEMPDLEVSSAEINTMGDISLSGTYFFDEHTPFTASMTTHIENTSINLLQHEISINNIHGKVPLVWPLDRSSNQENIVVDSITWKNKTIGNLEFSAQQHGSMVQIQGTHTNKLLPGLQLNFNGGYQSSLSGLDEGFTLLFDSEYEAQAVDLSELYPMTKLIFVDGKFQITGKLGGTFSKPRGSLQFTLTDGLVEIPGQDMTIEGIKTSLILPELSPFHSNPSQVFNFDSFTVGDISVINGAITYQMESANLLFIEKGSIQWANGLINTYNLRFTGKQKEYNINLYAEQLSLGKILEQFGFSNADGEGSVNGRISLGLHEKEIVIRDSFLYSTPGTGGSIKLSGTDIVTQGMDMNTPRFSHLDFAAEALREFRYNWVNLNFANEDDNLVMKMEMDGKPGRRLPFRYDSQSGAFIRLQEKDTAEGIYHPIRLDVNFKLPLNTILKYKKSIDDALGTFQ